MHDPLKAIAFDLDAASLKSLRVALPGCAIEVVNGATPASLARDWHPGEVDLLVVQAHEKTAETLGLCRFLISSGVLAPDFQETLAEALELPSQAHHEKTPLLVLVRPGRASIVKSVLKTGAHSCLLLPIYAKEVASMLGHAQAGNKPGRHTLNLETAQVEDRWRDDGGQG